MLIGKKALLLDMNGTFMFGEDRFDDCQDFSAHYGRLGGTLPKEEIHQIIRAVYGYLSLRYPDEQYRHDFPSVRFAISDVVDKVLAHDEIERIIETFTHHELGFIPREYVTVLHTLRKYFQLAAVIDIWSPKEAWVRIFDETGILPLFSALSFSSDHGMVKPSAKPFKFVLTQLGIPKAEALVVGDSVRRDLGGAKNAGIDCILVGGAEHPDACRTFSNLIEFTSAIEAG
ncbi:MAG: hypothetical protein NPIRA02_11230 [Nitrospirales bacterium]|nr:MAG: hypothetical protein NPIRA02_11230 [Nitrospirales bacterium]